MRKLRQSILVCWLGLLMALPVTALADISSQQASDIARRHTPGRVLAVTKEQYQERTVFRIKILSTHGEVHVLLIDAKSGERIGK